MKFDMWHMENQPAGFYPIRIQYLYLWKKIVPLFIQAPAMRIATMVRWEGAGSAVNGTITLSAQKQEAPYITKIQAIPFIGWLTYPSLHWKSNIPKLLHSFCPIRLIRWMSTIKNGCHKDFTGSRSVVCAKLRIEGGVVSIVQSGPITMWSDTTIFAHARIRGDSPQNSKMWCITTDIIAKPGRLASQKMWCEATL